MPLNRPLAVIGTAMMVPFKTDQSSLEEILYEVSQAALKNAGLDIEQLDGIALFDHTPKSLSVLGRWLMIGVDGKFVPFNPAQLFLKASRCYP